MEILKEKLTRAGLKVTPQRLAILEAVYSLENHPRAEQIIEFIRRKHPNIATGTVYKVLETLVIHKIVTRVNTDHDIMRYDGIMDNHHHLYSAGSDRIMDYSDPELDRLLSEYFSNRKIPGFRIEEVKLQIKGEFLDPKKRS